MIRLENLHKRFGKVSVLDGVSFSQKEGGVLTILGPNGSGKTTLIKAILGMVVPDRGDVYIDEELINHKWTYRKKISYLPQIARFPDNLTTIELIKMIKTLRECQGREAELIALFKLEPFLNKKLGNLSGGTRQKVNLVIAFMFESPIIILDEPTTGLDPVSLVSLKKLINEEKAKGKIILITTHILSFVEETADQIVFLLEGNIYFKGSPGQLKEKTGQNNLEHAIAHILEEEV